MDDPLGTLLPPAVPLMVGAGLVGTALLWTAFGRRLRALVPLLFSHGLLVFFVGHNLAILGLVEFSSGVVMAFAEFAGLTVFLGGGFAASVWLAQLSAPRARDRA